VAWSWWDHCHSIFDPRPVICRPVIYDPCPRWVVYRYPVWTELPAVSSGTWVEVPEQAVDAGLDLQLLAVRFVDSGHSEKQLGPRYRVWFRNNSSRGLETPFNVVLLAANDRNPKSDLPQAGVRVKAIDAGQIQSVDIRLPFEANGLGRDEKGRAIPFSQLHVLLDAHREVPEGFEENNGSILLRGDILPVDPATFSMNVEEAPVNSVVSIAGEGFGPEPGKVIVHVNKLEFEAEIEGWYDLGIQLKLPNVPLASVAQAEIIVVRGDGAVANPLPFTLQPAPRGVVPPPTPNK